MSGAPISRRSLVLVPALVAIVASVASAQSPDPSPLVTAPARTACPAVEPASSPPGDRPAPASPALSSPRPSSPGGPLFGPSPSPSPSSSAAPSPSPSPRPVRVATVTIRPRGAVHAIPVRVFDASGCVTAARALTPAEHEAKPPVEGDVIVAGEGDEVLLWWIGSPCETAARVTVGADADAISVSLAPRPGCDARSQGWGIAIRFAMPVDPSTWELRYTGSVVR